MTLRPVDADLYDAVVALAVAPHQRSWVATTERSLAQAAADPALRALAAFDARERGMVRPTSGPVGFALIEVRAGVGFIQRLLIDARFQGRGYGRALLTALVRHLDRIPDVELVATSHRRDNPAMAALVASAGFVAWSVPWPDPDPDEVYVHRPTG